MTGKLSRKKSPDVPQTHAPENDARHTAESFRQLAESITEKEAYEHSLFEVETRFRAFMDNAPFHAYIKNRQGRHLYGNLKSLRDLGMALEEFQRTTVDDIFPEQIAKRIKEVEEKVFKTGKPLFVPEATVAFDGKERWVEEVKFPFHGQSGEMYLGGISLDVTDRKLSQIRLQESENRYRTLFENMTQGVFYQDREGKFLDANKAALDILGFERDVFLKEASAEWPWKMLDEHGQELPRDERPSLKALSTGRPVINSVVAVFSPKKKTMSGSMSMPSPCSEMVKKNLTRSLSPSRTSQRAGRKRKKSVMSG